jgi:predicted MFS family arabinose efflux permease
MILIVVMLNADQNLMNATLSAIEKEFHVNDADIGLMSGLFTLLGAVISLLWGYFADKGSRKMLFIYSVLIGQIPCLFTAFSMNYAQFFTLRILTGFGVGASFPIIFSLIGDLYEEKKRASATAYMTAAISIGQIVGLLIGGYVGPTYGWRLPFILASVPNLFFIILFYILVQEPQHGASEESLNKLIEEGLLYPKKIKLRDYLNLIKIKTNVFLFVQGLLGTIPWGAIPLFLIKFFNENKGLSIEQATTVFLLFGIGMTAGVILGGMFGGMLFKKKSIYMPLLCSTTTLAGSLVVITMFSFIPSGNLPLMLLCGFVGAFLVGIAGPNIRTMLLDTNVPENRGAIFSIFNLTDSVGTGAGKFIGGILSVTFGLTFTMNFSAAFWIPCAVLLWIAAFFFQKDIDEQHKKMLSVAKEMKK